VPGTPPNQRHCWAAERPTAVPTQSVGTRGFVAIALVFWAFFAQSARAIDFHDSIEAARKAHDGKRPMVITFGAPWCGYCRKMQAETLADKKVEALAKDFVWVKIDIDEDEELAARYRVRGVPHTAVLDAQNRLLGSQAGFMPPDKFIEFLQESLANPMPMEDPLDAVLRKFKEADAAALPEAVKQAVTVLAKPDRTHRKPLLAAIAEKGPAAWPPLLDLMADERLSTRAAAASALAHATSADLPFQPFDPPEARQEQLAAWRAWVEKHRP
jgi:thioredoxin-related protein